MFQFFLHECLQTTQHLRKDPNLQALIGELPQKNPSCYFFSRWRSRLGHLQKLRYYHLLLDSHKEGQYKEVGQILGQTWIDACQALRKGGDKQLFALMKERIKRVARLFIEKVSNYRNDENVLFFLICHFEELDDLCGKSTIAKTLIPLFKDKIQGMSDFLSDRYLQRGFNHLLPIIHKQVGALQKDV